MAGKTPKKSAKVAKKGAAMRVAVKAAKPRNAVAKPSARKPTKETTVPQKVSCSTPNSASQTTSRSCEIPISQERPRDSHPAADAQSRERIPACGVREGIHAPAEPGDSKTASKIRFSATLLSPRRPTEKTVSRHGESSTWTFLTLPQEASAKLPSRGMASVEGTFNGFPFQATLEPDGQGGHWLKVDRKLREAARAQAGDVVTLEIAPVAEEPEPTVPADLRKALAAVPGAAGAKAREVWSDITPAARRDFIHWIVSPKQAETRARRVEKACDMLAKGKRRPCCFDRSGMYDKSLCCPVADDELTDTRR